MDSVQDLIERAAVELEVVLAPTLNFAFYQNSVPVIRDIAVVNEGATALEAIELRVASEPAFLAPKIWRIERIGPAQRYHLFDLDVDLDGRLLSRLTEAERAEVRFTLRAAGHAPVEIVRSIELLARNQWAGIGQVPELLAAFVQPNDPAVDRILKKAAEVLRAHGKDPALDGYRQGGKARAWELASALWAAVRALNLDYALPPASFEKTGQKVRSPSQVCEAGLGTCLDLTLLFAACLEQLGLNPVIVFTDGHSLAGCWLKPEEFATAVVDDVTAIRKRISLEEMILFETTVVTGAHGAGFAHAIERGVQQVSPAEEDRFEIAVDIRRARLLHIRPLAAAEAARAAPPPEARLAAGVPPDFEEAPPLTEESVVERPEEPAETPSGRLARWQRRLLDLSLRNNLLNFRASKRVVTLDAPEPARLEDCLAEGRRLKIRPRPAIMEGDDPRNAAVHQARHHEDARRQYALEALARDEVLVGLPEEDLEVRLVELYRAARLSLQEGGANTLFLALGFLNWKRDGKDDRRYRAPLILVPVALERRSVRSGFRLVLHEDEPRFNPTLIEMLRQDFKLPLPFGDGELPKDEAGLDVRRIWRTVAEAIKEIPGWEVTGDVVLSTFSFAKYLMWKDLVDRTDQLKQNPVVRHLIDSPREPYPSEISFPRPERLDDEQDPARTFCPLPADSSQLCAVAAAARGKDFVLVGPPGTGKSQTISNMIAQCLAEGKTVLFVSEKIAALDVVYRRLRSVGLGDFCLELHSNKARKADVLAQLKQAWAARGEVDRATWEREAARLKGLRDGLNGFVRHLHHRHRNGLSARTAIGRVVAGADLPPIDLSWPSVDAHDEQALDRLRDLADRLQVNAAASEIGPDNPLRAVSTGDWSPGWQQALIQTTASLGGAAETLERAARAFLSAAGLPEIPLDEHRRAALAVLAEVLPQAAGRDWRFVLRPDARSLRERLELGIGALDRREAKRASLSLSYRPDAVDADIGNLAALWREAEHAWWPRRMLLRRQVRRRLTELAYGRRARPDCARDLELLMAIRELDAGIHALADLSGKTGGVWSALTSDRGEIRAALTFGERLAGAVAGLATDATGLSNIRAAVERLLGDANALLEPTGPVATAAQGYREALMRLHEAGERFDRLAGSAGPGESVLKDRTIDAVRALAGSIVAGQAKLHAWCAWRRVRTEAVAAGLGTLVDAIESGVAEHARIGDIFETNYCRWWLAALVEADAMLRTFVSAEQERRIEEFRRLDDRLMTLTRDYVRARLCSELPDLDDTRRGSEWGTLRRELEKKARHMPLRELVASLPNALTKLAPCLLMSPLSIAQYLSTGQNPFDVVVFDEASQIPVWDAVGAIARGRQAVIVGDPKQLPPTSFFDRAREDEDEDVVEDGDLESILDECLGANLPALRLNWHYRSRHEGLIAFSNHRYYDGGLVTFPSPVTEDRAVSFHYVEEGQYEKGGARINKPEAWALVADIVGRLKDPGFAASGFSMGVVTFNAEQQRLIEDLLDLERRKDPSIEPFFAEDHPEALFVKNLESVQGDERDVMYFSITYGPDRAGVVSMNFGPMNRDGGERRLNVAITRARHRLKVFSSLLPERIDLSRTQARGVRDLKHFLEFALRGPRALAEAVSGSVGDFESPFEQAVAAALRGRGWEVHPQIGVSGFRVDLGVVYPDKPGVFLAGVECDGATYHRAATARDRDRLREQVLVGLGWEIVRIWSPDWWIDPAGTLDKVDARLRALLDRSREGQTADIGATGAEAAANLTLAAEDDARVDGVGGSREPIDFNGADDTMQEPIEAPGAVGGRSVPQCGTEQEPRPYVRSTHVVTGQDPPGPDGTFRVADPASAVDQLDPEAFYEPSYDERLAAMIRHVIAVEGPIRDEVLARRIGNAHGFQRTGSRIRERVVRLARREARTMREDIGEFFWPRNAEPGRWAVFRRPGGGEPRAIDDVAMPELVALARVLAQQGLGGEEAVIAMARTAGLQRLRAATRGRLERAWREARATDA